MSLPARRRRRAFGRRSARAREAHVTRGRWCEVAPSAGRARTRNVMRAATAQPRLLSAAAEEDGAAPEGQRRSRDTSARIYHRPLPHGAVHASILRLPGACLGAHETAHSCVNVCLNLNLACSPILPPSIGTQSRVDERQSSKSDSATARKIRRLEHSC